MVTENLAQESKVVHYSMRSLVHFCLQAQRAAKERYIWAKEG